MQRAREQRTAGIEPTSVGALLVAPQMLNQEPRSNRQVLAVAITNREAPPRPRLIERNTEQAVNLKIGCRYFARHDANREVCADNAQCRFKISDDHTMQHTLAHRRRCPASIPCTALDTGKLTCS